MSKWIAALLFCVIAEIAAAQQFPFSPPDSRKPGELSHAMERLADAVLPAYRESNRETFLDNLFRVQMVAGRYADAANTIETFRALPHSLDPPQGAARDAQYEILARAVERSRRDGISFGEAFQREFRSLVRPLDNRTSALVMRLFNGKDSGGLSLLVDQAALRRDLQRALDAQKGKTTISLAGALTLIRAWQAEESYRTFMPFAGPLVSEDDNRRYIVQENVQVRTPEGAIVCAQIMRPRVHARLPTLLEFTVYGDVLTTLSEERRSASNGYVGITGFARGKMCSPDVPVPLEHDGADAAALIDWIAKQPWSDGRVGMFGGSYDGFTQWAATKHMPAALRAIMPSVATAPGVDMPMEGNVRLSFNFYWPLYVANGHGLDGKAFEDQSRWNRLFRDWYVGGRAYHELTSMARIQNPIWNRWVSHPDYDGYWQAMIPQGREYARINIPVLATTGYYDGAELGALHYFGQLEAASRGEHYLVIGPYTHVTGQRGTVDVLGDPLDALSGYKLDPVAEIDMGALRYQWFDYVFRHGPKPVILKDAVNYEVMDANLWRHVTSLAAMGNRTLHFHPGARKSDGTYSLTQDAPAQIAGIVQTIRLADRSDADRIAPGGGVLDPAIDTWLGLEFVSAPFANSPELGGFFSGTLRFVTNKRDFDFGIQFYELKPDHKYLQLGSWLARASYVTDASHRHLLVPSQVQELKFRSGRLTVAKFARGSRLVMILFGVRQPNAEIDYGTGGDVARETIADARTPLMIKWLTSSVIDVPARE